MAKMRRYSSSTVIDNIAKGLLKAGWTFVRCKRHPKLRSACGTITVTVPSTPSDRRVEQNWIHQLRRMGVEVSA